MKTASGKLWGFANKLSNVARAAGVTIVASAGNEAQDLDHDGNQVSLCTLPAVICVSATAQTATGSAFGPFENVDTPTWYTNYGRSAINVAAPGGTDTAGDGGWIPQDCSTSSLVLPFCQSGYWAVGGYGTSSSAPHVSGLAALLVEQYGRNPARIRAAIDKYATDLGLPGVDPYFGHGRIDVPATLGL